MLSRKLCKVHLNLDDDKLCDIDFMGAKVRGFRMDFYQADDMIRKMEQFVLDHSKLSLEQLMESDFSMLERETLVAIARNNGEFLPNRLVNCLHLTSLCCYLPANGYEFGMAPLMNNKLFCLLFINFWFDNKDELKNYWMQLENAFPEDDAEIYRQFQKDLCYYISFRFYPSLDHIFTKHYLQGMSVAMESLQQSVSPPLISQGAPRGRAPSATLTIFMTPPYCGCSAANAPVDDTRDTASTTRPRTTRW